ncbi:MAG: helix-turn-helix domain-containing protein, partial [Pseudomonadota bacterium]
MSEQATDTTGQNEENNLVDNVDNNAEEKDNNGPPETENTSGANIAEFPVAASESDPPADEYAAHDNRHQTWGAQLREGREKVSLSREEVSKKLFLALEVVEALEAEDYKRLPPDSYVQGYLRNYARFLSLDPDAIIDNYKGQNAGDDPVILAQVRHVPANTKLTANSPLIKIFTAIVVIGILTLAVWGWQQGMPDYFPFTSTTTNPTDEGDTSLDGTLALPTKIAVVEEDN